MSYGPCMCGADDCERCHPGSTRWVECSQCKKREQYCFTSGWSIWYDDEGICDTCLAASTWVDIAPHLSSNLWMVTTPGDDAGILLTLAPSHAKFLGFVYGDRVYKHIRYNSSAVIIPDAVRFRTT